MEFITDITPAVLYRLLGKNDQPLTICFKTESKFAKELSPNIVATLDYTQKERKLFDSNDDAFINTYSKDIIKVNILDPVIDIDRIMKYKLDGIKLSEIDKVLYFPLMSNQEKQEFSIKSVPNIIKISYEPKGKYDYENLFLRLCSRLIAENKPLLYNEKMEYLGIQAAFHDKKMSSTLLKILGITLDELTKNPLFWVSYYKTKEVAEALSDEENQSYTDYKAIIWYDKLILLAKEITKAGKLENNDNTNEKIRIIGKEIENFKVERLNIDPLIYWDLESYLHIVLRHFKETKIGMNNQVKTEIPYKLEDLRALIEKIIYDNMEEIEHHFNKKNSKKFFRSGPRAIYFNQDYYSIDIEPDGRIKAFYKN